MGAYLRGGLFEGGANSRIYATGVKFLILFEHWKGLMQISVI